MIFYDCSTAPSPRRARMFMAEKGIGDIEMIEVNLVEGEQRSDEHLARNEAGTVPVLELDDGEYLTESLPIMEYLEELYPQPVMIGVTPEERARTRAFERQVDTCVLMPITRIVHATRSPLGLPPSPSHTTNSPMRSSQKQASSLASRTRPLSLS